MASNSKEQKAGDGAQGKESLHWFWRGTIAATAGLITHALLTVYTVPLNRWGRLFDGLNRMLAPTLGDSWAIGLTATIVLAIPSFALAFIVYSLLTRLLAWREGDGETHCRACGQILRGLSEPRCPECGERI